MAECVIKDWQGNEAGTATLDLKVASEDNASHIVHRALVRQMNNARQGTSSTKTRSEVRGGGRKPWRQKGTGRARAGSTRSPLMPGGGIVFGPKPRDYTTKMNRKERQLALRTAFQGRVEDLIVVQDFMAELPEPKTKAVLGAFDRWGIEEGAKVLMITAEKNEVLYRSIRNVPDIKLISAHNLNVYDMLLADKIVATADAIAKIQEVYGG
ncbi:MAG: 50S ribosomal protein L4 [Cyanobacteria bacterium J06648_16]